MKGFAFQYIVSIVPDPPKLAEALSNIANRPSTDRKKLKIMLCTERQINTLEGYGILILNHLVPCVQYTVTFIV